MIHENEVKARLEAKCNSRADTIRRLLERICHLDQVNDEIVYAVQCMDKVFQDYPKHKAMLPDFLKLGESKFKGVIKLAEKYKALLAENARLRRENEELNKDLLDCEQYHRRIS